MREAASGLSSERTSSASVSAFVLASVLALMLALVLVFVKEMEELAGQTECTIVPERAAEQAAQAMDSQSVLLFMCRQHQRKREN